MLPRGGQAGSTALYPLALGSIPSRSTAHYRRLAARSKTARAQPSTLSPAACLILASSSSVRRMTKAGFRFSESGILGRPLVFLLSIK
jgi:hypothetical protein